MKLLKNKKKKNTPKIIIIALILLLLSSVLSLFAQGNNTRIEKININVRTIIINQEYTPQTITLNNGSTLYELLKNELNIQFEQDGDVKSYQGINNNFITQNYWQVLVNNETTNLSTELNNNDEVIIYYGSK